MAIKQAAFKFQPFSVKQLKILTWWCKNSPVRDYDGIIADGAIRSGKTVAMAMSFVFWAMDTFDNKNLGMCGKTIGSFRRNVLFWLKPVLILRGYKVEDHRIDNRVTITYRGKVNYFYVFGGKDEQSQDLIQGITLAGILFDEVALMPESFVKQGTGRCSVAGSKYWFNCNPDSPMHWFNQEWIKPAQEGKNNILYLHFLMEDNLSLGQAEKDRYYRTYRGLFFKRFILGLWVLADGAIYDMWDDDLNTFDDDDLTPEVKTNFGIRRYIGIDYGTSNPTVFLDVRDDGKILWVLNEYYYDGRKEAQRTDKEHADQLIQFLGLESSGAVKGYDNIILDPSAASFKAELKQRGLRVTDADNEVLDGIRMVSTMFGLRLVRVHKQCKHFREEVTAYIWDAKAGAKGDEKPVKENDHCMDGIRYIVKTKIKARRLAA